MLTHQHAPSLNKIIYKYANRPIKTHTLYNNHNHTKKRPSLLHKAQLHVQEGGGDKSTHLKFYQTCGNYFVQQMSSRGKAVHDAIMKSPTDTNMEDTEDTMVIGATQSKRSQEAKKGGSSSKRKKNVELTTGLKETPKDFWLGIVAMEKLAIDEGVKAKDCRPPTKKEELITMGIKEAEAEEISQLSKIAFPHVRQLLYPLERPDGKGGQHFNLTQLPIETEVDPGT